MPIEHVLKVHKAAVKIIDGPSQSEAYSNFASISVSNDDVVIHFAQRVSGNPEVGKGVMMVFMGLAHAKRLALALNKSLGEYEKNFGEIITDPIERLSPEARKSLEPEE